MKLETIAESHRNLTATQGEQRWPDSRTKLSQGTSLRSGSAMGVGQEQDTEPIVKHGGNRKEVGKRVT